MLVTVRPDDRPLCVLPFPHAFGNSVLQSHILAGAHLILDGSPMFPESIIESIREHDATSLSAVPDLFQFLLARSSLGRTALPSGPVSAGRSVPLSSSTLPTPPHRREPKCGSRLAALQNRSTEN